MFENRGSSWAVVQVWDGRNDPRVAFVTVEPGGANHGVVSFVRNGFASQVEAVRWIEANGRVVARWDMIATD